MNDTVLERLGAQLTRRIAISEKEVARAARYFDARKLSKGEFLLREGDVCKDIAFVVEGCLRSFTADAKGEEHVIQFAVEDWWISDLTSYLSGVPSTYTIEALEDSEVLLLSRESRDRLLSDMTKFERFFRLLQEANYIASHKRIAESLSEPANVRYLEFLRAYPNLAHRVSQHHIASYLGITPQSLSRIRRELSERR
jgi:CRP-like cAMP-binding protein